MVRSLSIELTLLPLPAMKPWLHKASSLLLCLSSRTRVDLSHCQGFISFTGIEELYFFNGLLHTNIVKWTCDIWCDTNLFRQLAAVLHNSCCTQCCKNMYSTLLTYAITELIDYPLSTAESFCFCTKNDCISTFQSCNERAHQKVR